MIPIQKYDEPDDLIRYKRETTHPTYDGFKRNGKERDELGARIPASETPFYKLRNQLLVEQKFVCAYCGQELRLVENPNGVPQMKTEHFSPQDNTPENDLGYQNLLACCLGWDNKKGKGHCDSWKGEYHLEKVVNPATIINRDEDITYIVKPNSEEVQLICSDKKKQDELTGERKGTLNLNHDDLQRRRFDVYKNEIQKKLGSNSEEWIYQDVKNIRDSYSSLVEECRHRAFKDFILWYLDKWLSKHEI